MTFWMRFKKKDLQSEAGGSSGSSSELVFQAEDRSLPVVRHRHVLEYTYRGGGSPCGIVRGVHFVGSAPVHVLNLVPSLVGDDGTLVIRVVLAVTTLQSEAVRRRDKESTLPHALWSTGDGPVEENLR